MTDNGDTDAAPNGIAAASCRTDTIFNTCNTGPIDATCCTIASAACNSGTASTLPSPFAFPSSLVIPITRYPEIHDNQSKSLKIHENQ